MQKKWLLCSLLISGLSFPELFADASAQDAEHSECCGKGPRPMRAAVRHIEAKGVGYNVGYSTLESFFAPADPWEASWIPFLDVRGHLFNNGEPAANAGIGLRHLEARIWGLNLYYDYRKTRRQHYNQVAIGFESLGEIWDFRANGYLPVGRQKSSYYHSQFDSFAGHTMLVSRKREFAMGGINAEAGAHIDQIQDVPIYLAAGPYYLTGEGKNAWGGEARISFDFFDYLRFEANTSYDTAFKWIGQAQLSVIIPFGGRKEVRKPQCSSCCHALAMRDRAYQRVDRSEIIPVDHKHQREVAIDPFTGQPYFFVFVDNEGNSNGTIESRYPTLLAAQNNSSPRDVIYVFPGDGTKTGMDQGITLQDNQKLWGAGMAHPLETTAGTITIPAQAGSMPTISASSNSIGTGAGVRCANNNDIAGLRVQTANFQAILASGVTNVQIHANVIDVNSLGDRELNSGINFVSVEGEALVFDNIFNVSGSSGGFGIAFNALPGNASYWIDSNHFSGVTDFPSTGIEFGAQNAALGSFNTITVSNNSFTGVGSVQGKPIGGKGFNGTGKLMIDSNTFSQSNAQGDFVKLGVQASGDVIIQVTNNLWKDSLVLSLPAVAVFTTSNTSKVCVTLSGNQSDSTPNAYSYDNTAGGTFIANPASDTGSNNIGHIEPLGVITPGVCP